MNRMVNFHMHSLHSDGIKDVRQLVEMLSQAGASWFTITDHYSTACFTKSQRIATEKGLYCCSGTEIAVSLTECNLSFIEEGDEIHLLAYDFDIHLFSSYTDPFNRKRLNTPKNVFEQIKKCDGLSIWAHPLNLYNKGMKKRISPDEVSTLASWLKKQGISGLEAHYYDFSPELRKQLASIADNLNLIKGIGTDYHGWAGRDKPCMEAPEEKNILLDILIQRKK